MTPVYYVVTPSPRLKEYLEGNEAERQILLAPALFNRDMPRKIPPFWSKKPIAESKDVKLAFLAMVIERTENRTALRQKVEEIIGVPPYKIAAFDHWWELHEIRGIVTLSEESLTSDIEPDTLKLFDKTGDPAFDHWLDEIIKTKEQRP
ncbi:MAG: hypothetical protein KJ064_25435 [Anaerolineae bacterium]|nr:hypothetical protein [Anaerolineae bacterium]